MRSSESRGMNKGKKNEIKILKKRGGGEPQQLNPIKIYGLQTGLRIPNPRLYLGAEGSSRRCAAGEEDGATVGVVVVVVVMGSGRKEQSGAERPRHQIRVSSATSSCSLLAASLCSTHPITALHLPPPPTPYRPSLLYFVVAKTRWSIHRSDVAHRWTQKCTCIHTHAPRS